MIYNHHNRNNVGNTGSDTYPRSLPFGQVLANIALELASTWQ